MKILWFICLLSLVGLHLSAQDIAYSSLKDLVAQKGDTLAAMKVEKRTKNQIVLTGGADYKISAGDSKSLCRYLKDRCYAVQVDTSLYINCKKLRYKRLRFGGWYAPALRLNGNIFFSAMPLGSVIAGSLSTMDITLGGSVGGAIASSGLVSKRVYYEIDVVTDEIDFVGKERMSSLLESYPDWQTAYLQENSESAKVTGKYLKLLESAK